jgi:hypothetical protein
MQWKQPEGFRRHWVLDDLDAELLFLQNPVGAAQGRLGDDVFDLRESGVLRKRRTLLLDGQPLAELLEKAAGAGGELHAHGQTFTWKPANLLANRWILSDPAGQTLFTFTAKPGLAKTATVDAPADLPPDLAPLLLLCWYVTVL